MTYNTNKSPYSTKKTVHSLFDRIQFFAMKRRSLVVTLSIHVKILNGRIENKVLFSKFLAMLVYGTACSLPADSHMSDFFFLERVCSGFVRIRNTNLSICGECTYFVSKSDSKKPVLFALCDF